MIVKEVEVKAVRIKAICECGGEFKPTGLVLTSYPPQYEHKCNKCHAESSFMQKYPYIKYIEVE